MDIDSKMVSAESKGQVRAEQEKVCGLVIHYPMLSFLARRESKSK